MLPLLIAADAAVLRATVRVDGPHVEVVSTSLEDGDWRSDPGDLAVLDAAGEVLVTGAMPPLATHRAVSTPDGHLSAPHPSRYARVRLPWPDGAAAVSWGGDVETPWRPTATRDAPEETDAPDVTGEPGTPYAGPTFAGPVVTRVVGDGPTGRRLDLVILAEGYTADQEDDFSVDVATVVTHFRQTEPWSTYGHLVNVWKVFVPSVDEGIDTTETPGGGAYDTPFECYFSCEGIQRLICCDEDEIIRQVDALAPFADGILLLSNSEGYGGSGGLVYSVASVGVDVERVAVHELAHSLVLLWDEYSYGITGDPDAFISPNCAPEDRTPPWTAWMDDEHPDIGTYPTCSFTNWVRPTPGACMMNALQPEYCPVCREHIVRQLYRHLGNAFTTSVSPPEGERVRLREGESQTFTAVAIEPPDGLTWTWELDGEVVAEGVDAYTLDGCGALNGELALVLRDETPWVRGDPGADLVDRVTWPVTTDRCAGDPPRPCGCAATSAASAWSALALLLLARRRRS